MDNRLDNIGVSINSHNNTNIETELAIAAQQQTITSEATPFKSRFKTWIRAVAIAIVVIFIPEQISWAFNYDPRVLWDSEKFEIQAGTDLTHDAASATAGSGLPGTVSAPVAETVKNILSQIVNKQDTRLQLSLSGAQGNQPSLAIDPQIHFNAKEINAIYTWLLNPQIHPLNCGVYALRDILTSRNINVPLEELSVSSLLVDLLNNIVKPGEEKLKTSLYAIEKIVQTYGLNFKAAKLAPADVLKIKPAFIANFDEEHFVTVTSVDETSVNFTDIGRPQSLNKEEFVKRLSGFVLAGDLEQQKDLSYELVSDATKAFVWGNRWIDNSDALPGLLSGGELAMQIGISVGMAIISALLPGLGSGFTATFMVMALASAAVSMGAGQLGSTTGGAGVVHARQP